MMKNNGWEWNELINDVLYVIIRGTTSCTTQKFHRTKDRNIEKNGYN